MKTFTEEAHTAQEFLTWVKDEKLRLLSMNSSLSRLDEVKFRDIVLALLELDKDEARYMHSLSESETSFKRCPECFHEVLEQAIHQFKLFKLFARANDGEYHRMILPAAYNERTGQHYPEEMARWRSDFRAMNPEQQMMTATIVWMYRGGPDSIWLRRVPCSWKASEAVHYMHDTGCLGLWLQLMASYPGW